MYQSLVVLALCSTIGACAAPQAAAVEPAKPAQEAEADKPADKARVCEEVEEESTGTRLGTDRVCRAVPPAKGDDPETP